MPRLFTNDSMCHNHSGDGHAKYVSWDDLRRVITEPTILSNLKKANIPVGNIIQYILAHAKILFALAKETNIIRLVPEFIELKLTDDYLPILIDDRQTPIRAKSFSGAPKDDPALSWFQYSAHRFEDTDAYDTWISHFYGAQWKFLAPVFTDLEIVYPLHDESPLPFISYSNKPNAVANSLVHKGAIHPFHWQVLRRNSDRVNTNGTSVPVAIKVITKEHEATDMWVQVEVAALELVRSLDSPHLINFLTSYRRGGNHYLIFDWADGGDLKDFWLRTSPLRGEAGDPSHRDSITWAVNQMAGLAKALYELHGGANEGNKERVHCRHGDLKPANIVRSRPKLPASHGHLRITDMGVAKINDKATHVGRSSGPLTVTIRYQSPEFLFSVSPDAATSRAYDIWSMGCTFLEFIIWLLYGHKQLDEFNKSFPNTTFFTGRVGNTTLNPLVKHWVDHTQGILNSDDSKLSCMSKALKHILDFLIDEVLIPDSRPELRIPNEIQAPVEREAATGNAPGIAIFAPPKIVADPIGSDQHGVVTDGVQSDIEPDPLPIGPHDALKARPRPRAKAKALWNTLEDARKLVEEDPFNALRESFDREEQLLDAPLKRKSLAKKPPGSNPVPPEGHLEAPQPDLQLTTPMLVWARIKPPHANLPQGQAHPEETYLTEYLRDSWDHIPDSDLALELFSELKLADVVPDNAISPEKDHVKGLCVDCSDEKKGVFSLLFVRKETVGALRARDITKCGVCWMLLRHANTETDTLPLNDHQVKFLRSGTYLMQSFTTHGKQDRPIFSLIAGPGVTATPKDLQRSFPMLPQLITEPGREATDTVKPKPTMTITGEEAKFTIMKKWLDDCNSKHKGGEDQPNCNPERPPMRLPTRLIYVGEVGLKQIYLDCEEDRDKKNPGRDHRYIALSHRWGYPKDDPEWMNHDGSIKTFCTTDHNIVQHKDPNVGIDFTTMPKTFRDAIEVTRGLGLKYVWIDSLCIIQNQPDNKDFNTEAGRMADVYSGAYCTVASTAAKGTTDGFFNEKDNRGCCRIETTRRTPTTDDKDCTVYICDAIDDFKADVNEAEMATRGWIFQERGLSRRTLHFGKNQMYWECGAGVCCETMTRMFNRKGTFMSDPDFPSQAARYNRGMKIVFYQALYQHYSGLSLSRESDRAVAMESLEKKIFVTFQTRGAYGVMDDFLHRTLLWKRQDKSLISIEFKDNDRTPPSWSWMALKGKIDYLPVKFGTVDWVEAKTFSPFRKALCVSGTVPDNQLAPIKAIPREINWEALGDSPSSLIFDCDEESAGKIEGLRCVVMGTKKTDPAVDMGGNQEKANNSARGPYLFNFHFLVLLVAPKIDNAGYKRVGVGGLEEKEMKETAGDECIEIF